MSSYSQSQDSLITALKHSIKNATTDSAQVHHKLRLIKKTYKFDIDTSRILLNEVYDVINSTPENKNFFQKSKAIALNYSGILDSKQANYEKALAQYLKALDISQKQSDSATIALSFHNLGMFYRRQKTYNKSKDFFKKAISIYGQLDDTEEMALSMQMLGISYLYNEQLDSSRFYLEKVKRLPISNFRKAKANGSLASIYYQNKEFNKAISIYKENTSIAKKMNDKSELSTTYLNIGVVYNAIGEYEKAVPYLDSAINVAKEINNKQLLYKQYYSRSNLRTTLQQYQEALEDFTLFKIYSDSINDIESAKRITSLELNYQFAKEKEASAFKLKSEKTQKQLYLTLLITALVLSILLFWIGKKISQEKIQRSRNKLQQRDLEKLKAELTLVTKEKELKKAVIENSLRKEVLQNTLQDIKAILKLDDEADRKKALQSLTRSLLSEDIASTATIHNYLDKVNINFKVTLDTKFPQLSERDKELLSLMTLELKAKEISTLLNTTTSSIKSSRSRIRKKLNVDSTTDLIAYIQRFS